MLWNAQVYAEAALLLLATDLLGMRNAPAQLGRPIKTSVEVYVIKLALLAARLGIKGVCKWNFSAEDTQLVALAWVVLREQLGLVRVGHHLVKHLVALSRLPNEAGHLQLWSAWLAMVHTCVQSDCGLILRDEGNGLVALRVGHPLGEQRMDIWRHLLRLALVRLRAKRGLRLGPLSLL